MTDSFSTASLNEVDTQDAAWHQSHIVQFYSDDASLLDTLSRFIGGAIAAGDAAVVVATREHHAGLAERLRQRAVDAELAIREGRYVLLSAEDALQGILVDGRVDEKLFKQVIGAALDRARNSATRQAAPIVAFGELVGLLWAQGKAQETIRVEHLWNQLSQDHNFSLLCGYPVNGFRHDQPIELFLNMCRQHSAIIPGENDLGLRGAEQRLRTIADLQQRTTALEHALQMRHSEERFRQLVEAVQDYAIYMIDPNGFVISWNIGAQRIKGYQAAEIIGKHFSCFYPAEDLKNHKPEIELRLAVRDGRFEDEGWRVRKDGSCFWANVIITPVYNHGGKLVGFGKVTRDATERMRSQEALQEEIRERKDAERRLSDSENALRQLSRHLLRTQDEERRRIGRELHDSLGQSLSAVKMTLDLISHDPGAKVQASEKIMECSQLVEHAIQEVRTLSYLLYPPMLEDMGLKSAILWYLDGFALRSGIKTTFEIGGSVDRLDRDVELVLFRVLQESLTNIHRHSQSPSAQIRLGTKDNLAVLEIRDRGKGLAADVLAQSGRDWTGTSGVGLRGMNERLLQVGGKLEVSSSAKGTTVRAIAPLAEEAARVA